MERAVRKDKKTTINPIVRLPLYDSLCRLTYVCDTPIKTVGETLVYIGLNSRDIIQQLSTRFRRPYWFDEHIMFNGDKHRSPSNYVIGPEQHRISLRFRHDQYERLKDLAYAMDLPLTKTTSMVIETTMNNAKTLSAFLLCFVRKKLERKYVHQLLEVVHFINMNVDEDEQITLQNLLFTVYEQIGEKPSTFQTQLAIFFAEWANQKK